MDKQTHAPGAKPPIGRKERRSAIARRANAVFTSMVVLLAQVLSAVGAVLSSPAVASAAEYGQQVSLSEATQAIGRTYTFRTSEGSLAWCGDRHASHPDVGRNGTVCEGKEAQWHGIRNDDTTLTGYTDKQMRMIDYLVFVGNRDITASGSAFGMWGTWPVDEGGSGASKAAVVVQAAIWMVSSYPNPADVTQDGDWSFYAGDCYGDDAGTGVYAQDCILNAYNEAKAYAEGGAGNSNIDGCARVIKFGDDCQDIFFYTAPTGSLTLKKVSGITSITDSNACYDISGAQYGVYSDPSCSDSSLINTLQTDLLGNTGVVTGLSAGTYYVKETKAAPGYKLCTEVHAVNVTSGATATVTCSEPPAYDIVDGDLIGKHDSKIDYKAGANTAQGGSTLKGAQFTIEYYDTVSYDSYDALKKSGTKAKRTWVVETDANGMAKLSAATKVSGDALYTVGGQTVIPRGTVVIRETKAPEGYKLSSDVSFQTVQKTVQNGSSTESFHTIHTGVFSEDDIYGGLAVNKIDHDRDESVPQGDATLEGAEITIKNVSGGRVYVKGKWYDDGADVMTIRTDKNGHATTGTSDLPFGIYECRETKAPTGYLLNSTWRDNISVSKEGEIVESTNDVDDTVIRGGISVEKVDKDTKKSTPQGNASIDGAKIGIINRSEESVKVKGVWYASGAEIENCELTIKDGKAATGAEDLPYGTYELYEKASGEGYKISSDWKQEVKVEKNAETVEVESKLENEVYRGGVRIVKYDSELEESTPQGDATLADATFSIQNASDEPVDINGTEYEHGAICLTLDTKAVKLADGRTQYIAECSDILPYGHYRVYETSAAEGYGLNAAWNQEFDITEDGQVVSLIDEELGCDEDVIRGGISVTKADRELNKSTALGAATLAGCHLSVKNVSEGPVKVNGVVYESGQLINGLDLVTDENGNASTDDDALPYGTYEIRESIPSQGYELNTEWVKTVEIREHKIYPVGSGDTSNDVLKEQVKRADFALGKVSSKGDRLANVAFLVTSKTTGEAHVVVTQGDGSVDTSTIKHSKNTNASDAALTNGTLDESKLDSRAGIWFSGSATEQTPVDDRLGALPYDVYTVEELRCSANKGHRLVSTEMTVDGDGVVIKVGDLCDEWVELSTEMTYDNGHTVPQGEKVVLTDVVTYKNLAAKSNYTLKSELHLVNSAHTDMGVIATSEQTFRTGEQNGSIDVVFSLDTSVLTDGSYLVAFEEIYDAKGLLKEHKDINDENQTVTVVAPTLSTSAIDVSDGDKNVIADGQASVADTVYYENLAVGTEYTISGVIMNPRTKNTFKDANGNEVRASKTFTATSRNGSVDLLFDFDASGSDDHSSLVLFATLSHGDKIMVQHTDWDDAKELLSLERPKLTTTAVDGLDGDKTVTGEAEVSIVDTVHYENIRPNHKYTLSGTLMNKKTGKAFVDADGKTITATSEFTPESSEGDVKVTFTFNASELTIEDQLVVFEELSADGKFLADHANINDEGQTVTIGKPTVTTSAYDGFDEDSVITGEADAVLIDTVHYEGVTPGKTYKVDGTLMDKKTGEAIKGSDGNAVTASAEFTPTSDSGDVNVTFTFDAGSFNKGDRIVAFETLSYKGVTLATHTDIDDGKQTVSVTKPELSTTASDAADGDKEIVSEPDVSVTDKVHYKGVTPGKTYKVTGTLMNKASGKVVTDVDGNPVTAEKEFTPKGTEGDVEMTFTFDATAFTTDDKLVVFEALSYKGTQLAAHADLNDKGQTVTIVEPALGTEASDGYDGDKDVTGEADASVIDVVHYSNVNVGKTYTVTGTLMDKQTGKAVTDANGKAVTATKTFTAEEKYGDIELTFEFDASEFKAGDKLVAFESMSHKGVEVGVHADLEDEYQTVTITKPELKTTAVDKLDGDKNVIGEADVTVVDTVHYKGVTPGKTYKVTGTLMDKQTGEAVKDEDGDPVTSMLEFTPEETEGDVDLLFSFDGASYKKGDALVVFESLSYKGKELVMHADLEDVDQTVTIIKPELKTTATDVLDGDKNVTGEADVAVKDKIHYKNVTPGKTYKVTGTLMNKSTGKALTDDAGNVITAEAEFTPESGEGDVEVIFYFDAGGLAEGDKLVAFETLFHKGAELSVHADLDDVDQTVDIVKPELKTTAVDKLDGDKNVIGEADVTVVDTVHYKGVTPGKTYKVTGTLMDKQTGEAVKDEDGDPVTAEKEFTAQDKEGDVDIEFTFDAGAYKASDKLVAFESISYKGRELATHADLEDEDQTVTITKPELKTTAVDKLDGDKNVIGEADVTVVDTVHYKGVTPGKTYKVTGTLMDKQTGEAVKDEDGDPVTAEKEFTAQDKEGDVDIEFTFDAGAYKASDKLVAFESISYKGRELATHADLEDEDQTVTITKPELKTTAVDKLDGDKNVVAEGDVTVVDTVHYKGVTPGKTYKVEGVLMEKTTDAEGNVSEEKFLDADGNEAKAEVEFTPEGTEGDIEVTFSFDATGVADGTPLVAFESISHKGRELAVHADITDEDQTVVVEVPEVHTTATDAVDGDKDVTADPTAKVIDAVEYKGLTPGKTYKVEGVLMQKVTDTDGKVFEQEFVAANGDRVTAEAEFTPEKTEGSVDLTFEFDASLLSEGEQLVAFEDLIYNGKTIAVHADIKDEAQTVTFHTPKIGTTATDAVDGDKFIVADAESTVDDRVAYEGIAVGQKYTLVGMLMNKETGLPVLTGNGADEFGEDDLKTFMAEVETLFSGYAADDETEGAEPKRAKVDTDVLAEFCDKNAALIDALAYKVTETEFDAVSGSETISISFDGRDLIGEDDEPVDTVVFELLLRGSIADAEKGEGDIYVAAEHADITDEGQTVTISPSSIGTTAVDKADSDKELEPAEKQAITDTVVYKGLIPGKEYKLHATLMDKNTGKELTADGKAVTAELTFTPTDADGQVDIDLGPFDASELGGHTLVVFEELTRAIEADGKAEDTTVAVHKDIDDEKQSVTVKEKPIVPFVPVIPTNHVTLQTGIDSLAVPVAAAMIATAGAGVAIIRKRRRE